MLDVALSYSRYKFLGYEYLTWLWFVIDNDQGETAKPEQGTVLPEIGNRIVLVNNRKDTVESITIKGDDAGLEEGILALRKGAVVTELNLSYKEGEQEWRFTLKAESLDMVGLKCPQTGSVKSPDELEGAVLEKTYLYDKATGFMDNLFKQFITLRVSENWGKEIVPMMRQWIHTGPD